MKFKNIKNKKAVIGKTISWFAATILIFLILIISIFITSSVKRDKKFLVEKETTDLLAEKSLVSYLMTEDEQGEKVFYQLVNEENLNDFNGNFAKTIFKELYGKDYPTKIWLGVYFKEPRKVITNEYFGSAGIVGKSHEINLKENKFVMLTLTK